MRISSRRRTKYAMIIPSPIGTRRRVITQALQGLFCPVGGLPWDFLVDDDLELEGLTIFKTDN